MNTDCVLTAGTRLAVLCTYRDVVAGNGFMANIDLSGRVLACVDESGEVWVYGVDPSGWAESGKTFHEAHAQFRATYTSMLFDLAAEAKSYADFEKAVRALKQTSDELTAAWLDAAKNSERPLADKLGLPIESKDRRAHIKVTELPAPKKLTPSINKLDEPPRVLELKPAA